MKCPTLLFLRISLIFCGSGCPRHLKFCTSTRMHQSYILRYHPSVQDHWLQIRSWSFVGISQTLQINIVRYVFSSGMGCITFAMLQINTNALNFKNLFLCLLIVIYNCCCIVTSRGCNGRYIFKRVATY